MTPSRGSPTHDPPPLASVYADVRRGAGVELVERAMPQAAVGIDDRAGAQRGDPLLQPPRRALGRRAVTDHRAEDGVGVRLAEAAEAQRAASMRPSGRLPRRARRRRAAAAHRRPRSRGRSSAPMPPAAGWPRAPGTAAAGGGTAARRRRDGARSARPAAAGARAAACPARAGRGDGPTARRRRRPPRRRSRAPFARPPRHHPARRTSRRARCRRCRGARAACRAAGGPAFPRRRCRSSACVSGPRQPASWPSRSTASSRRSSGVVSEMRKKPSPLGP